jgi:hypothetical protein
VRAHESDCGLDLLAVAEDGYLRGVKFKTFHVRHITELLRSHIIDEFSKESYGWEAQYIDFFYDYTFPTNFAHAVMLVAECFAEYLQNGKYQILDSKTGRNRRIAEFIITDGDVESLRAELQSILDPAHAMYDSWEDSASLNEWRAHVQMLSDTLTQALTKGGGGNA